MNKLFKDTSALIKKMKNLSIHKNILQELKGVSGLKPLGFLKEEHKLQIKNIEKGNNLGVLECLNREHTLLLSHNSNFRSPIGEIVRFQGGSAVFPPVPFPEVRAENVVSSSPSLAVHNWLLDEFDLKLSDEEATLLIGFDFKSPVLRLAHT